MSVAATPKSLNLPFLVLARVCTTAIFMTYPACLNTLITAWNMSATQAGGVQGMFTAVFALSLLVTSFLCDRIGARHIFNAATLLSAISAVLFAVFARSFESAIVFVSLMGLAQGGTYTSAIMIVSAAVPENRKASAVGWVLAGMSAGYVLSIFLSTSMLALAGYQTAFAACAAITILGWVFGYVATRTADHRPMHRGADAGRFDVPMRRRARLLTLGYIGHTWELLGAWAWIPAFLAAVILTDGTMSAIELGLWTALALHLSGFFASFLSGYAADRFGAENILIAFAALGVLCSVSIGWLSDVGVPLLFAAVTLYGFVTIGDSSVLSSAMTDAVPPQHLGRALGLRSVLGVGAGAISPVAFGVVIDLSSPGLAWGLAFASLAFGGLVATICAVMLQVRS